MRLRLFILSLAWLAGSAFGQLQMQQPFFLQRSTSVAVDPRIILWWKFTDGAGTTITATVGPNGTTDATWVTGESGSGFANQFDGTSQEAFSASNVTFATNIITVSAWVYLDVTNVFQILLETSVDAANNPYTFIIYAEAAGRLHPMIHGLNNGYNFYGGYSSIPLKANAWQHIFVVMKSTGDIREIKIWQDGVSATYNAVENTLSSEVLHNPNQLGVFCRGAWGTPAYRAKGRIDDIRIYAGDVSADVATIYADPQ